MADAEASSEQRPPAGAPAPSHLAARVVSALVLIPLALAAVYLGGVWLAALVVLGGLIMSVEWTLMLRLPRSAGAGFLFLCGLLALGLAAFGESAPGALWVAVILGLGAFIFGAGQIVRLRVLSWLGVALVYCWSPVYALIWLRQAPDGLWLVAWVLLLVWATDIGGYFAGRTFGGPKLAPRISPNKTWSGLMGGMALAALAGVMAGYFFAFAPVWLLAAASAVLAVWAQIGDLTESAIKRHFGVKDTGRLIPGHGGLLDRVDGLVFVAPVVALGAAVVQV